MDRESMALGSVLTLLAIAILAAIFNFGGVVEKNSILYKCKTYGFFFHYDKKYNCKAAEVVK